MGCIGGIAEAVNTNRRDELKPGIGNKADFRGFPDCVFGVETAEKAVPSRENYTLTG